MLSPARALATVARTIAAALPYVPHRFASAVPVGPPRSVDGNVLDPHAALLIAMAGTTLRHGIWEVPIETARRELRRTTILLEQARTDRVVESDRAVPGASRALAARIYRPRDL